MSKKSLLCCTAIALFGISFNAQAKYVTVLNGQTENLSSGTHEAVSLQQNSKFIGKNLTITGKKEIGTGLFRGKAGMFAFSQGVIDLENVTIKSESSNKDDIIYYGIVAFNTSQVKMKGGSIEARTSVEISANNDQFPPSSENILENVKISGVGDKSYTTGVKIGVKSSSSRGVKNSITLKNVTIANTQKAIDANSGSHVEISGGSFDGEISGMTGAEITLNNGATVTSNGDGLHANGIIDQEVNTMITMTGGTVTAKESAFFVNKKAKIDITNVASAKAEKNGIRFDGKEEDKDFITSEVNLTNTKLFVENGTGILVNSARGKSDLKNAEIHANILLNAKKNKGHFTLNADNSILKGDAKISTNSRAVFNLKNGTVWTLKINTIEKNISDLPLTVAERSRSDISVLNLDNSEISFDSPTEGQYQTLRIGSRQPNTKAVYNASGNAKIGFNIAWSNGDNIKDQKTDRLLIHGDVKGTTTVYIKNDLGKNSIENAGKPSNVGGISLIQVSGEAKEDSFKLANGYTTLGGQPYKYILTAYGLRSSNGKADISQNLLDIKIESFWDFRLHKEFLDSGSGTEGEKPGSGTETEKPGSGSGTDPGTSGSGTETEKPGSGSGTDPGTSGSGTETEKPGSGTGGPGVEPGVAAVVPQVASYIVMPSAIFHSGFSDMVKQNALLANIRATKNYSLLFSSYGSTATLTSERGPLQYGYGADMNYTAAQAGATLTAMENQNLNMHVGILGSYGQLAFTPKDMKDASKSTLDKFAITAYASLQHNSGAYVDALASYAIFNGNITNALIGNTAELKNTNALSASATLGMEINTNIAGISFEPQAQLVYQQLKSDAINDADNLIIDLKNPHQWLLRIGGNVAKAVISGENGKNVSLYGKLNFIKAFDDDAAIHIGKDFDLDSAGSSLEGGLGVNAKLSHNIALHGDISYQQNLQKTGISGVSFSGGVRYQF